MDKIFKIVQCLIILSFSNSLMNCETSTGNDKKNSSNEYRDITKVFSEQDFEDVKNFILKNGNQQTYSNLYNNNPHFSFEEFNVYLNPEIGQSNMDCDTSLSDFNQLVIQDLESNPGYYYILLVREGDLQDDNITPFELDLEEKHVYVMGDDDYPLDVIENNATKYLKKIKDKI